MTCIKGSGTAALRGRRILLTAIGVMLIMFAFFMMSAAGSKAYAASTVVDENWVNYTNNGDGTCRIDKFNHQTGVSPKEIIIPKEIKGLTVREIGKEAFLSSEITKVTFASGSKLYKIGESAFRGNAISELNVEGTTYNLPTTVAILEKQCFQGNTPFPNLDLSNLTALDEIPYYAFARCTNMEMVKFPASLVEIGEGAFYYNKLKGTIEIPKKVEKIGDYAFANDYAVSLTLDLHEHEPGSVEGQPWFAARAKVKWSDKNQDKTSNTVLLFDKTKGLIYGMKADMKTKSYADWNHETGLLTIPSKIGGVDVLGFCEGALATYPATEGIKTVRFGNGHTMKKLPRWTFFTHIAVTELNVTLPDSIETVESYAFTNSRIANLTMPGVRTIEESAFGGCRRLKKVTFGSSSVSSINNKAFSNAAASMTEVNLPQMNKDSVAGAPWGATRAQINWKNGITEPNEVEDSTGKWIYSPATKTITAYLGTGGENVDETIPYELTPKNGGVKTQITTVGYKLFEDGTKFKSLTISGGITTLAAYSLNTIKCPEINLPDSIITLGTAAFQNTGADFRGKNLPEKLTTMGTQVFDGCTMNTRVILPGKVDSIPTSAFSKALGIGSFLVKQYRLQDSDGVYDDANGKYLKSPASVQGNIPFGVSGATVLFMDDPRPVPKYTITRNTTANNIKVKIEGYTNNQFHIVKALASASGQPALTNIGAYPTQNGVANPATAELVIASKTASNIKGGNGDYEIIYTYGNQNQATERKNYPDTLKIDVFHTITYNANGGGKAVSGAAPAQGDSYVQGAKAPIKDKNTLAITGYTFKGWNTKADGTGTTYQPGVQLTMGTANITLYAKWEINKATVTLDGNEGKFGTAATKTVTGNYGTAITAASGYAVPTRPGFTFLGWAATKTATAANVTTMPAENTTYYAVWAPGNVAVTLDGNGGTINGVPTRVLTGSTGTAMTLPAAAAMSRDGYIFSAWYDARTGGKKVTDTTFPTASTTYFARWAAKSNEVKFEAGAGGKTTTAQTTVMSGNAVGVEPTATADGGYTFTDTWECSEGGIFTSAEVKNYVISGKNSSVTFTAQFTLNGHSTIIYDFQGGVTELGESLKVYSKPAGTAFDEILPEPKRKGFIYTWSEDKPSEYPAAGEVLKIDALWTPEPIKVGFEVEGEGGTVEPAEIVVETGSAVGIVPTVTAEEGYEHSNIWKCSDGSELTTEDIAAYVVSGEEKEVIFTTTFVKKAEIIKVIFAVEGEGGKVEPAEVAVAAGAAIGITPKLTADEGYEATNIWKTVDGKEIKTEELAAYIISGTEKEVKFTTSFKKANIDVDTDPNQPFIGNTEQQIDQKIEQLMNDNDVAGSTFGLLQFRGVSKGNTKIKLNWAKPKGAVKYVLYGSKCGSGIRLKKMKTFKASKKSYAFTKIKTEKLKKGKSYKYLLVAFDKDGKSIAVSKTLHIRTDGGKYGNFKSVNVSKPITKKAVLSVGKALKVKAKAVKGAKKVTTHRKLKYESSNPDVATVGASSGKIKAKGKGKAVIYVYEQAGQFQKIKITVK
ncbi:MAG: leucine-rich repeat protein [Mogibacterium sp.]|nr:leucine-rich repeat protein [Mogibacterium sp.]